MQQAPTSRSMGLFAVPGFLLGASRALDLGGTLDVYNESDSGEYADIVALMSDWRQVGDELRSAMESCDNG